MKQRFTLIELLVVVTIIAILASMLLPSLQAAKNAAKKVECVNNLKNIAVGQLQYVDDHDAYFAFSGSSAWHGQLSNWMMQLHPYIAGGEAPYWPSAHRATACNIFGCPTVRSEGTVSTWAGRWEGTHSATYGMNAGIGGVGRDPLFYWYNNYPELMFNRLPAVSQASGTHLVSDNGYVPYVGGTLDLYWSQTPTSYMTNGPQRHGDGGNVVFIDGHVNWLEKELVLWPEAAGGAPLAQRRALFDPTATQ